MYPPHQMHLNMPNSSDRCHFYIKMGACRHGDQCTKLHIKPTESPTVLFPKLYPNPLAVELLSDYSGPREFDAKYIEQHFIKFYKKAWRAFMAFGKIHEMWAVSNLGDHLLGNVYIRFETNEDAAHAVKEASSKTFHQIPLLPELSPVTVFNDACCKEFLEGTCRRGPQCNYLHIIKVSRQLLSKLTQEQEKYWKSNSSKRGKRQRSPDSGNNSPRDGDRG